MLAQRLAHGPAGITAPAAAKIREAAGHGNTHRLRLHQCQVPEDYGREPLESLEFITRAQDLVLYGDVGTGKTSMATALVAAACRQGIPARFFTASSLVMMLRRAKDEDRLDKELASQAKNQLLAIDELGYLPIDTEGARPLFQVIADGYEKRSLIITTNFEFSRWGTVFGDDNMTAAVIDRLVHPGRLLQFRGESYRVKTPS